MKLKNERYLIQGVDLLSLAADYQTPLYVYDSERMREQYQKLKNAFSVGNLRINYACKALTNPTILKLFHSLGAGLDAVSIEEIRLGLIAGYAPDEILYTPSCASEKEINKARELGVRINLDSLQALNYWCSNYPGEPVGLRINPHIMAGGNPKISVGHIDSKFGISIHMLEQVHELVSNKGLLLNGMHMHTGSDILEVHAFMSAVEILLKTATQFEGLEYLDFGSGFKVAYREGDIETDIEEFGKAMSQLFRQYVQERGESLELIFEPGKYLVSHAGYFLVETTVVKESVTTIFAGVDSGFNHLVRPMMYDAYHHILNLSNPQGEEHIYSIVGYICETDTFAWNRKLPRIRKGDILAFCNTGAYCSTMASNYNSRLLPAEVLIHQGQPHLIKRRQEFDDLLHNVEIPQVNFK